MDNTRITLVIDRLGPAGAQRDLCRLAVHLKRRGYDVDVLVFRKAPFLFDLLEEAGLRVVHVPSRNWLHLLYIMRREIRWNRPDAVSAFSVGANVLVEFAGLPRRDFAIIVTELGFMADKVVWRSLRPALHRFADAVVCNSHTLRNHITGTARYLQRRTHVVVNGVDLEYFKPDTPPKLGQPDHLRTLVLGSFRPLKNPFGLLSAVEIVRQECPTLDLVVDWYGKLVVPDESNDTEWSQERALYYRQLEEPVAERSLRDRFRLHPGRGNVAALYRTADAVCLPSLSEGTPNVICEARSCGVPVLAARVGGIPHLLEDRRNGFLFDPNSPRHIADAIVRFTALPLDGRLAMGLAGRKFAETRLSTELFGGCYVRLIDQHTARRKKNRRRFVESRSSSSVSPDGVNTTAASGRVHPPGTPGGRLRLLYVTSTFRSCGPTFQLINILRHVDYDRFEVSVVTLSPETDDSIIDRIGDLPIGIRSLKLGRISGMFRLQDRFDHIARLIEPDLIHSSGWRCDSVVSKSNWNVRWVVTCRNNPYIDYPQKFGRILGTGMAGLHVKAMNRCRNLVFCSDSLKMEHPTRSDATVIANGVECPRIIHPRKSNSVFKFITVGQLTPRKNIQYLCEIFKNVDKNLATLTVVGDGPAMSALQNYEDRNILFTGHQNDVYRYLADSEFFISASLAEGFPNAVLEALAMGLPSLLSNIAPHLEIKKEMCDAVEIFSLSEKPAEMANKLPGHISRLSKVSKTGTREKVMEKYSARKMSLRYQELYSNIIANPP